MRTLAMRRMLALGLRGGGGGAQVAALMLDSIPSVLALSTRKLITTYVGNCLRLRRSTDDAESDFGFSGNWLDAAAIATWLAGGTGYIVTWYDQSGGARNFTQADPLKQPVYASSVMGSKPCVSFDGAADTLVNTSNFYSGQSGLALILWQIPSALAGVVQRLFSSAVTTAASPYMVLNGMVSSTNKNISVQTSGGSVRGSTVLAANTPYLGEWVSTGSAYGLRINSVDEALTVSSGADDGTWFGDIAGRTNFAIGALKFNNTEAGFAKAQIAEIILLDGDQSANLIGIRDSIGEAYSLNF
jgi:hypothetical protein